jgi:hypothetical protein
MENGTGSVGTPMTPRSPSDRPEQATRSEQADGRQPAPKPYRTPVLTEYGSISKLTRSGGSTMNEGGMPQMMMACL